jgi:hypothetical protein
MRHDEMVPGIDCSLNVVADHPGATAALLGALYTGTIRWTILLRTHNPEYRVNRLFRPYLIAALFNNVMTSSTGGDLIRSYYIYRHSRDAVSAISPSSPSALSDWWY